MNTSEVQTIHWDYHPKLPFGQNTKRWQATINGDGYAIDFCPEREVYTAAVRCERIGFEYANLIQAMEACTRTAGWSSCHHTWSEVSGRNYRRIVCGRAGGVGIHRQIPEPSRS